MFPVTAAERPMEVKLPTENRHLFSEEPEKFYMYTYRKFEGVESRPWTSGAYGYVRTLRRTPEGIIGTKFHEGIDIKPVKRDKYSRPLDIVMAIAPGEVVYVNPYAGNSNYGKYVVLRHDWGMGEFFSLYAHLATVSCSKGESVTQGAPLGKMGYTGAGINRERAHLHLELGVMMNRDFQRWYDRHFSSKNKHGLHSGLNMIGMNVAEVLIRSNNNPRLTMSQYLRSVPVAYKVTVPRKGTLDIAKRSPWICVGDHSMRSPSWEISFAQSGFPLAIKPSMRRVAKPTLSYLASPSSNHRYHSKGFLLGSGRQASLSKLGLRTISLLTGEF
ncbi:murein hydrolase activator EnvC family protein [Rubritalea marina]|uniref:murein hydrolase activator EnvC family protein n=1 Tax=Rubritalea marina TaxID=361055 RepID=UPI000374B82E|nr:M23 family metallopeptidase [Rubritalea marina]